MKQIELPGAYIESWDWQVQGSCRGSDSSLFFHPDGERGSTRRMREQRAKIICSSCPVLEKCRNHALSSGEPYGIWGGMSEGERRNYPAVFTHLA